MARLKTKNELNEPIATTTVNFEEPDIGEEVIIEFEVFDMGKEEFWKTAMFFKDGKDSYGIRIEIKQLFYLVEHKEELYPRIVIEQAVMDGISRFRERVDSMANQDVTKILEISVSDLIEAAIKKVENQNG